MSPDAALAAIKALDTDGSGKVEKNEVEAFAHQQGLSAEQVSAEFKDLDTNGNGELEAEEISRSLAGQPVPVPASFPQTTDGDATGGKSLAPSVESATMAKVESAKVEKVGSATVTTVDSAEKQKDAVASEANASHQEQTHKEQTQEQTQSGTRDLIQETSMLEKAKQQASRAVAEAFASSASSAFSEQKNDDVQAQNLTELARSLRGQAAKIASTAQDEVQAAAAHAAATVLEAQAPKVLEMQQQAANLTVDAEERRKKAREAMDKVTRAQAQMREMVK